MKGKTRTCFPLQWKQANLQDFDILKFLKTKTRVFVALFNENENGKQNA